MPSHSDPHTSIKSVMIWDGPIRLFHWSLVIAVLALIITGNLGGLLLKGHITAGLLVLGLLLFRLCWGVVGSTTARFSQFTPSPATLMAYGRGQWQGVGHNPLGALSVYAMLALLLCQSVTGLFSYDDIAFQGPLAHHVSRGLVKSLTSLHQWGARILYGLLLMHLCAILWHFLTGRNLVTPMITGRKQSHPGPPVVLQQGSWWALVMSVAMAVSIVCGIYLASVDRPTTAITPVATPDW
ncbi:MAG: cytochrome b/b6 domain-containing protein [Magnetococcales bacterium]|nr:cytochrome b/b6 domain-containing protein [Magnetococcales bacterium]